MGFIEVEKTIKKQSYNMTEAQFHDFFEIYFLTEGSRQVFIENKLYKLTAPAVCFIPPFVMHKTEGESYERINVYISKEHISQEDSALLSFLAKTHAYQLNNSQKNFVTQILEEAIKLEKNAPSNIKNIKSSFIKTVIYYLSLQNLTPIVEAGFTKRNARTDESILKIVSYLNENYQKHITLDQLSKQFFLSKNTLCLRFKKQMNCSIINYITFVRINKAKSYLSSTNYPMDKIAELCGFPSANYFGLIFKKNSGISPMSYRKKK